jgi:hypothetical protein
MMMMQVGGALPNNPWELVTTSSVATKLVLLVLLLFSLICWFLILLKWMQFRRVRKLGTRFFNQLERTNRLEDAYHAGMKLPPSPFGRLLREGVNFFSELRPGALQEKEIVTGATLSATQLEVLKMQLAKEIGAERARHGSGRHGCFSRYRRGWIGQHISSGPGRRRGPDYDCPGSGSGYSGRDSV